VRIGVVEVMNATHTAPSAERFAVPAFIAAAFHVVLLFAINPPVVGPFVAPPEEKVLLRPFPKELLPPPTDVSEDKVAQVKPLNPGPVRPVTEDRSTPAPTAISMDSATTPVVPRVPIDTVAKHWGDGTEGTVVNDVVQNRRVFTPIDLDRLPRAKAQPAPDYPLPLRQAGVEGSALVEFDVDASGRVVSARSLRATHREFEEAAVRAVLRWRFEPGHRDGRPVPFRMVVPIGFSLGAE
jgi:protein TonB